MFDSGEKANAKKVAGTAIEAVGKGAGALDNAAGKTVGFAQDMASNLTGGAKLPGGEELTGEAAKKVQELGQKLKASGASEAQSVGAGATNFEQSQSPAVQAPNQNQGVTR